MSRSSLPWWAYLFGAAWMVVLAYTIAKVVFWGGSWAASSFLPEAALTVLWGALVGLRRAWAQLCVTVVAGGLLFLALAVLFLWPTESPGMEPTETPVLVFFALMLPVPFGVLCGTLAVSAGFGLLLNRLLRLGNDSGPVAVATGGAGTIVTNGTAVVGDMAAGSGVDDIDDGAGTDDVVERNGATGSTPAGRGRPRLLWLTVGAVLWASLAAVGARSGIASAERLWLTLGSVPRLVVLVVAATAVWGAVLGALREWAEIPVALALGAVAVIIPTAVQAPPGPNFWGSSGLTTSALIAATAFGPVALALSIGVLVGAAASGLARAGRHRSMNRYG